MDMLQPIFKQYNILITQARSLRIVYNDKTCFSELFEKDGSVSINYQNIRQLSIEMFKVSKGLCPEIVKGLFQFRYDIPHNLRQRCQIHIPLVRTVLVVQRVLNILVLKFGNLHQMK